MSKHVCIRMGLAAFAAAALLSMGLAGCKKDKPEAAAPAVCAIAAATNAVEHPATGTQPATTDPAKAVPKDHPAH